jgi:gephyrin
MSPLDEADILLTTGGTSMGPTDLLKPVIERHFNGTIHFAVKPGKPTTFATIARAGYRSRCLRCQVTPPPHL